MPERKKGGGGGGESTNDNNSTKQLIGKTVKADSKKVTHITEVKVLFILE